MKKKITEILSILLVCFMFAGMAAPAAYAADVTDEEVQAVISQLEAIDSLATMQNKRSEYTVKSYTHYDINTTDASIIEAHETARANYENYVATMFAARIAAQEAYDALSASQQAQIDASLVAKLTDELSTTFNPQTLSVTPSDDEYTFETVKGGAGYGYEISNHMVSGEIPQTFILVDTSDGKTSWTPSGKYVCGESNYEVAYCCDVMTPLAYNSDYKRVNLEDSSYYGESASQHIRAILKNSYPYITMEQVKSNLKAAGYSADFVNSLTRSDMIAATQMAVWTYANAADGAQDGLGYFASIDITKNTGIYFTPLHDTNVETWDWLPPVRTRTYDARAEYRVNNLAYYLCKLPGEKASNDEIVISDVKVARADLIPGTDNTYSVGMCIYLNEGGSSKDNLKITVTSYGADGSVTGNTNFQLDGKTEYGLNVKAKYGDTIKVVVEGTQYLGKGVYFYEPEGGRDSSQSLVGVGEGETKVRVEEEFVFNAEPEMGLRIYKTAVDTGEPLSDITFDVYKIELAEGDSIGETPTDADVSKYATEANKVGSIVTDVTGYGVLGLEKGTYLVVEQHNKEKVVAPVDPFFISVPMEIDGELADIVSVYPKNTPVEPPEEPPVIPPTPDEVKGKFTIVKHDADDKSIVLKGAEFKVYRPATEDDTDTEIIVYNGVNYAVVPVTELTTGADGKASSPELECGTYYLVETKAPSGYHKLEEAIAVTVVSEVIENAGVTYIANEKGTILPETGGMGTKIFYGIGGMMMLVAVVLLVTRKRMSK